MRGFEEEVEKSCLCEVREDLGRGVFEIKANLFGCLVSLMLRLPRRLCVALASNLLQPCWLACCRREDYDYFSVCKLEKIVN